MTRTPLSALSLLLLTPVLVCAQAEVEPRKTGKIFKREVDQLVHVIARHTDVAGRAAPYCDSVLTNAKVLTALGHCHRFYVAMDHPRIRTTIQSMIRHRNANGSFGTGDAAQTLEATAWTIDALAIMDSGRYGDEIATAQAWLQQHDVNVPSFQGAVQKVLERSQFCEWPTTVGAAAGKHANALHNGATEFETALAVDSLVHLVACQVANRTLDKGQGPRPVLFSKAQQRAIDFLMGRQKDGIFMAVYEGKQFPDPAMTGFGLLALQTKPKEMRTEKEQAVIEQGLQWLLEQQNEDGSYGREVQNYTTSVVVGALARWKDPAAKEVLAKAQKFIVMCQRAEGGGYERSDRDYGSIGYGASSNLRGDLSNLNFALKAMRDSGMPANHEAFQKALVFLQRTQNLKSKNSFKGKVSDPDNEGKVIDVEPSDDGGATYYPGNSAAGYVVQPDGKSNPRSYGSMTYALLKSYTLCGIDSSDERVQAAVKWIENNWTLAENPGFDPKMGDKARFQGLFYYYMVLAQALDMAKVETVTTVGKDGKPEQINWRTALRKKLEGMQLDSGSWLNEKNQRWMEGYDVLCTCYAMTALERCR